jgi:multidrug efflux pump subunit AcrA (membrane-fusion protein)
MSGTSEVVTAKASDVAVVPARALVYDSEAKTYSVLKLNAAGGSDTVPVKLGFRDSTRVQITDGVGVGDTLLAPTQKVKVNGGGGGG